MDLKLGHYDKDGIEVIDVQGEIDMYTAPRLRELLIDLVSKTSYQLVVNLDKVGFLDSTGLGVLVGGLRRVRAHGGSLDLVCTREPILKIFRADGGLRHLPDRGPGHRGQEGAPVRNVSPGGVAGGSGATGLGRSHRGPQRNDPGPVASHAGFATALAEYVAVEARNLAPLPASVDHVSAAALSLAGLTAWQAPFDHAGLRPGQTVLVHGPGSSWQPGGPAGPGDRRPHRGHRAGTGPRRHAGGRRAAVRRP